MKLCQDHWGQLRAAINERGLTKYVASDSEAAVERLKSQLQPGEPEHAGFEPLINANFAICGNALEMGGAYLVLSSQDNGEPYCPICEASKKLDPESPQSKPEWWINNAADEQLTKARTLKLAPPVQ